jgi:hypothetical protein
MGRRLILILLISATFVVVGFAILAHAWVIVAAVLVAFLVWAWRMRGGEN